MPPRLHRKRLPEEQARACFRARPEDMALIRQAADAQAMDLSNYMRSVLVRDAKQIVAREAQTAAINAR